MSIFLYMSTYICVCRVINAYVHVYMLRCDLSRTPWDCTEIWLERQGACGGGARRALGICNNLRIFKIPRILESPALAAGGRAEEGGGGGEEGAWDFSRIFRFFKNFPGFLEKSC